MFYNVDYCIHNVELATIQKCIIIELWSILLDWRSLHCFDRDNIRNKIM